MEEEDDNVVPIACRDLNDAAIRCHQDAKDWRPCQQLLRQLAECLGLQQDKKNMKEDK